MAAKKTEKFSKSTHFDAFICYNIAMNIRSDKGKHLEYIPNDYTVVDIETTGLSSAVSEIIEISAIKYRSGAEVDKFSTLVKPKGRVSWFITNLTGITQQMADAGADIEWALSTFSDFLGGDVIVGYNVNFDINFLYDNLMAHLGKPLSNDYVDVLRYARRYLPQLPDHKQTTVAEYFGISVEGAHRAANDCIICNGCLERLRGIMK